MEAELLKIVLTAGVTGLFSTVLTVVALKVHIDYLRAHVERLDLSLTRAHNRIDEIKKAA